MKKLATLISVMLACIMMLSACTTDKPNSSTPSENTAFEPKLDTEKAVTLNFGSFFGNFEAFTAVLNDFNEFYPNVKIETRSLNGNDRDFLQSNPDLDIFMTSNEKGYPTESCVDLVSAGVDVSGIDESILEANKWQGVLYSIPMGLNLKGLVVNKSLLEKEGLAVPQTWSEFTAACEKLKEKGYTPVQGPVAAASTYSAMSTLSYNMGMSLLASDRDLLTAVSSGNAESAAKLKTVFERVQTILSSGYTDNEINSEYPANNYDGAIQKFFKGDVAFWITNTENVSGMKKRESKWDDFKNNPFEYEFIFTPFGENGAYAYIEPWYGFAANKNSERKDYAIEFLRFLARQEELNTMASVKGVPSVTKNSSDSRYENLGKTKTEISIINNGTLPSYYGNYFCDITAKMIDGTYADANAAFNAFLEKIADIAE